MSRFFTSFYYACSDYAVRNDAIFHKQALITTKHEDMHASWPMHGVNRWNLTKNGKKANRRLIQNNMKNQQ